MKGEPENVSEWRVVMQQNQSLEITKVALDAMGGDNAPDATIKGAVKAINDIKAEVVLIGNKDIINKKIKEINNKVKNIEKLPQIYTPTPPNEYIYKQ